MLLSIIFRRTLYKTGLFKINNFQSKLRQCFNHNPGQKGKEHLTKYELFMLKILESIRCCLWRGVNSCLTWLRTSLYMICLGGNTHLPSFLIYLLSPATVYSWRILETTTRSADGMGSLEELPLLVPEEGLWWKSVWKFGIAHRLGFSTCQC